MNGQGPLRRRGKAGFARPFLCLPSGDPPGGAGRSRHLRAADPPRRPFPRREAVRLRRSPYQAHKVLTAPTRLKSSGFLICSKSMRNPHRNAKGSSSRTFAIIPGARSADRTLAPEDQQISHMPQWHGKSASEYQRVLFKDLWYQNPSAQPSLRGSEPPTSTPRGSMRMACPPPMGAAARSMTWPRAASCAAIASGTVVSSCRPAP